MATKGVYAMVSPTYDQLQISAMPKFLEIAEPLGVVKDVRHSPPPQIDLTNGSTILCRSADQPDRLRGPDYAGAWLDEASYMRQEIFTVMIAGLRHQGERGWLAATMTPRGKKHWTYERFGTEKPDTAVFFCRSRDNPFIRFDYEGVIGAHMTSTQAKQELGGEFVDGEGALFKRDWFEILEACPPLFASCRAWDLASTVRGDFTCGVRLGKTREGLFIITDVRRLRGTPLEVERLLQATAKADGALPIFLELEGGASGKIALSHFLRNVLQGYNVHGIPSSTSKLIRAEPVAAQAEHGHVKLLRATWNAALLDELECFPSPPPAFDDQVDALSLAFAQLVLRTTFSPGMPIVFSEGRSDPFASAPVHGHFPRGNGPHTMPGYVTPPGRQEGHGRPFIVPGGW